MARVSYQRRPCAWAVLVLAGCAGRGPVGMSHDGDRPMGDAAPRMLESFLWERRWGPCDAGDCFERLDLRADRSIALNDRGIVRTAALSADDLVSFSTYVTGDPVYGRIADPGPCGGTVFDTWERVEVDSVGAPAVGQEIAPCRGEPWDGIRARVSDLWKRYFP